MTENDGMFHVVDPDCSDVREKCERNYRPKIYYVTEFQVLHHEIIAITNLFNDLTSSKVLRH